MKKLKLKREVNLFTLVMYGVGVIVGAGIYVLVGKASGITGNSVWMAFLLSSTVGVFTALSYAELSSMYPKDASEYHYIQNAFKKDWLSVVMSFGELGGDLIGAAAVSLGFAGYFSAVFGVPFLWGALGLVVFMSFINFWGIGKSTALTIVMTLVSILGLILIIVFGMGHWGSVDYFEMPRGTTGIVSAAALIFFAFLGFEDIVNISEEVKNARKVVPKALLISLAISSVLYVLVAISVVSVVDWQVLGASDAPLKLVAHEILGDFHPLMSFIILLSTGGTVLILLIAGSRMIYGLSDAGRFPEFLSRIHPKTRTPYIAVLVVMLFVIGFVLIQRLEVVAGITDFMAFTAFGLVNLSNIGLRYRKPHMRREFKVPLNIGKFPVLSLIGVLTCTVMIFFLERHTVYLGLAVIGVGSVLIIGWQKFIKKG